MKKTVLIIMAALILQLCGCGGIKETVSDSSDEKTDAEVVTTEAASEENEYMGNPWVECGTDDILNKLGLNMQVPEGASHIVYEINEQIKMGQIVFDYGDPKLSYTYRMKELSDEVPEDEFEDISGLYYDWDVEDDVLIGQYEGKRRQAVTDDGIIDVCLWYDYENMIICSLSTSVPDIEDYDITEVADLIYMP